MAGTSSMSGAGIKLERETTTSRDAYAAVGDVHSITSPSATTDELDATTFDSEGGAEEVVSGIVRGGTVTFEIYFDGNDNQHNFLSDDLIAGDESLRRWHITWPDKSGTTLMEFYGYVSAFQVTGSVGAVIGASVTIRVSGVLDFDHTP